MYNQALATNRNILIFYRRSYKAIVTLMYLLVMVAVLELLTIGYLIFVNPPPRFYAVHEDSTISAIKPLTQPNFASAALAQWEK